MRWHRIAQHQDNLGLRRKRSTPCPITIMTVRPMMPDRPCLFPRKPECSSNIGSITTWRICKTIADGPKLSVRMDWNPRRRCWSRLLNPLVRSITLCPRLPTRWLRSMNPDAAGRIFDNPHSTSPLPGRRDGRWSLAAPRCPLWIESGPGSPALYVL
jgi:hypothetical protein